MEKRLFKRFMRDCCGSTGGETGSSRNTPGARDLFQAFAAVDRKLFRMHDLLAIPPAASAAVGPSLRENVNTSIEWSAR